MTRCDKQMQVMSGFVVALLVGLGVLCGVAHAGGEARGDARVKRAQQWWKGSLAQRDLPRPEIVTGGTITGDVRVHRAVTSQFLEHARDVWVWLPPGYAREAGRRYPVLYMHDGNNVFDARTAFLGREWGVDEVAQGLVESGAIEPLIVVGVSNTPDRIGEYTWVPGTVEGHAAGGEGKQYARFLVEELKPLIDRAYRTKAGRADTGVMGSSLGGLISAYLAIHYPEVFGKVGVVSPSIWWSGYALHKDIAGISNGLKIWLDMGAHEGDAGEQAGNLQHARLLKRQLVARGYREGETLGYLEDAQGSHDEPSWSRRLPAILGFLYGSGAR